MKNVLFVIAVTLLASLTVAAQEPEKLTGNESFVILSTKRISTMEKELAEVAKRGYHVLYGAPTTDVNMALLLEKNAPNRTPLEYKILATSRISTMEKELNQAGALGYRLVPRTIIFKTGFLTAELTMVMEKDPESNATYRYDLVEAVKETSLHKKIDEAMGLGFIPATMITMGQNVVVMEKSLPGEKAGRP